MSDDAFKLPGSSYEEVLKLIQAYRHAGDSASPDQVSKIAGVDATIVSRNNGFLLASGVLMTAKQRKKSLTPVGTELAQAAEFDMADDLRNAWRRIVGANDFLSSLIAAVRIRNGMDSESLAAHIAYSAGQKKSQGTMTGARTVARVLVESGLLTDSGGNFLASEDAQDREDTEAASGGASKSYSVSSSALYGGGSISSPAGSSWSRLLGSQPWASPAGDPGLQFHIQIQVAPDDLATLGPKLRQLLADMGATDDQSTEVVDGVNGDEQQEA